MQRFFFGERCFPLDETVVTSSPASALAGPILRFMASASFLSTRWELMVVPFFRELFLPAPPVRSRPCLGRETLPTGPFWPAFFCPPPQLRFCPSAVL